VKNHAPDRGCVLNAEIECRTPAKEFKAELKRIEQQIAELRVEQDESSKTVERLRLRQADHQRLEAALGVLKKQASDRDSVVRDLDTVRATIASVSFERDQTADAAQPGPELAELRERITRGEAVIADVKAQHAARAAYQAALQAQKTAAAALAEAERACDLYGPKGARVKALEAALTDFHARINGALDRFGYTLRVVADPWLVLVNGRPASLLSKSERLQAGIAVQLAIAEISGFGFVAIDQVDLFDAENRRAFGALLDATPVQVLAAMTRDDTFEPPANDWTWLRIVNTNGTSTVVPCGETVGA
jgi:DNA repair exonuclease SbcCD ATPase subunit